MNSQERVRLFFSQEESIVVTTPSCHHLHLWNSRDAQNNGHLTLTLSNGTHIGHQPEDDVSVSSKENSIPNQQISSFSNPDTQNEERCPEKSLRIPTRLLDGSVVDGWWQEQTTSDFTVVQNSVPTNFTQLIIEGIQAGIQVQKFKDQLTLISTKSPTEFFEVMTEIVWAYHSTSRNSQSHINSEQEDPFSNFPSKSSPLSLPSLLCTQFVTTFVRTLESTLTLKKVSITELITDYSLQQLERTTNLPHHTLLAVFRSRSDSFQKTQRHQIQSSLKESGLTSDSLWTFVMLKEAYTHFHAYEYIYNHLVTSSESDQIVAMAMTLGKICVAHTLREKISYNICECILWAKYVGKMVEVDQKFTLDGSACLSLFELHSQAVPILIHDETDSIINDQNTESSDSFRNYRRPFPSELEGLYQQKGRQSPTENGVLSKENAEMLKIPPNCPENEISVMHNLFQCYYTSYSKSAGEMSPEAVRTLQSIYSRLLFNARRWTLENFLDAEPSTQMYTLYFWKPHTLEKDAQWMFKVGHISLSMADGLYISHWPQTEDVTNVLKGIPSGPVWELQDDIKFEGGPPDAIVQIPRAILCNWKVASWWEKTLSDPNHKYSLLHKNCAHAVCEAILIGLTVPKWKDKFQLTTAKRPRSVYNALREIVWLYHAAMSSGPNDCAVNGFGGNENSNGNERKGRGADHSAILHLQLPENLRLFVTTFARHVIERMDQSRTFPLQELQKSLLLSVNSLSFLDSDYWLLNPTSNDDSTFDLESFMLTKLEEEGLNQRDIAVLQLIQLSLEHFLIYEDVLSRLTVNSKRDSGVIVKLAQSIGRIFFRYARSEKMNCTNISEAIAWANEKRMWEVSEVYDYTEKNVKWGGEPNVTKISLYDLHVNCVAVFKKDEKTKDNSDCVWTAKDFVTEEMSKTQIVKGYFSPPLDSRVKCEHKYFRRPFGSEWKIFDAWFPGTERNAEGTGEQIPFQIFNSESGLLIKNVNSFSVSSKEKRKKWTLETMSMLYTIVNMVEEECDSCDNNRIVKQFLNVQKKLREFVSSFMRHKIEKMIK